MKSDESFSNIKESKLIALSEHQAIKTKLLKLTIAGKIKSSSEQFYMTQARKISVLGSRIETKHIAIE